MQKTAGSATSRVFFSNLKTQSHFLLVPFDPDDVIDFDSDSAVPEMHDRIIAGLARRMQATLLTNDLEIVNSGVVSTEW